MSSRSARVLRGLVAAGLAVFVAALSHLIGGGMAPGTVGVVLALAFSAVVCVALAGKTLSIVRLSVSVGVSQLMFHGLFSIGAGAGAGASGSASGSAAVSGGGMLGMASGGMSGMTAGASGHVGTMSGMGHGSDLLSMLLNQGANAGTTTGASANMADCSWMWLAHAVAALTTIVALRRGEAAFWGLYVTARMHVLRLVRVPYLRPLGVAPVRARQVEVCPDHPRDLGVFLGWLRHRGPPQWQFVSF